MKGKGFNKLRLAGSSAIGASMLLAGGAASRVLADEQKSGQGTRGGGSVVVRTGISWFVSTSTNTNGISGMGFNDASFTTSATTTGGATTELNDAFDGCEIMAVDGTGYADPDGVLDLNGDVMTGDPTTIAGLTVSRQFRWNNATLANGTAVVRSLNTFVNPGGAGISVMVSFGCNLGSDSGSIVEGTSNGSGNVPVTDDNLWFVTSDAQPYGDPPITHVRYGQGAAVTAVFDAGNGPPGPGVNDFVDTYALTVPPGQTRHILRYIGLSNGGGASLADAPTFENLASLNTAGLLAGIPPTELSGNVANFEPLTAPAPAAIPSMSRIGTWLLAGTLGLLAVFGLRRRTSAS